MGWGFRGHFGLTLRIKSIQYPWRAGFAREQPVNMTNLNPVSVLSAVVVLDHTLEGWSLLDVPDTEPRTARVEVKFAQPFASPPVVHVGIVGLDVCNRDNLRVRVQAVGVNTKGFTIEAQTWFNTQIWMVSVSWLAIGA